MARGKRLILRSSSDEEPSNSQGAIAAEPITVVAPRQSDQGEASTSGRPSQADYEEVLSLVGVVFNAEDVMSAVLTIKREKEWDFNDSHDAASQIILPKEIWESFSSLRVDWKATAKFGLPHQDGYWFEVPEPGKSIVDVPKGRMVVFLEHMDCGLRAPIHPFIQTVLREYNICLSQLHPMAFRRLFSFIYVCSVMGFHPTMGAWRCMYTLQDRKGAFWTFQTQSHTFDDGEEVVSRRCVTSFPAVESYPKWTDRFLLMRVPLAAEHPLSFRAPTVFSKPRKVPFQPYNNLDEADRKIVDHFVAGSVIPGKSSLGPVPGGWVPHFEFLKFERVLSAAGLSPRSLTSVGPLAISDVDGWRKLGLTAPVNHIPFTVPEPPRKKAESWQRVGCLKKTKIPDFSPFVDTWTPAELFNEAMASRARSFRDPSAWAKILEAKKAAIAGGSSAAPPPAKGADAAPPPPHREEIIQDLIVEDPVMGEEGPVAETTAAAESAGGKNVPVVEIEDISEDQPEEPSLHRRKRPRVDPSPEDPATGKHPLPTESFAQDFTSSQVRHFAETCLSGDNASMFELLGINSEDSDQVLDSQTPIFVHPEIQPSLHLAGASEEAPPVGAQSSTARIDTIISRSEQLKLLTEGANFAASLLEEEKARKDEILGHLKRAADLVKCQPDDKQSKKLLNASIRVSFFYLSFFMHLP